MFVPEQHSQSLLCIVPILLLGHLNKLVQLLVGDGGAGGPDQQSSLRTLVRPALSLGYEGRRHCLVVSANSDLTLSLILARL